MKKDMCDHDKESVHSVRAVHEGADMTGHRDRAMRYAAELEAETLRAGLRLLADRTGAECRPCRLCGAGLVIVRAGHRPALVLEADTGAEHAERCTRGEVAIGALVRTMPAPTTAE